MNTPIILHEDNHILVAVKPPNMPTQEDSSGDLDLLNYLKDYLKKTYNKQGNVFLGLVHRLDRPTGGLLVFAKTSKAAARLAEQMQSGDIIKKYYAIVCGTPKDRRNRLENWLIKNEADNIVKVVPAKTTDAKKAILDYVVLDTIENISLLEITLITGRSHQARVQLANIGTPIYGDCKYGGAANVDGNLALWAHNLQFTHPVTKKEMSFFCAVPLDKMPYKMFKYNVGY